MSLFITVTKRLSGENFELVEQLTFSANSAQEAAEMHQRATGAEEALVFPMEAGKRFRKAAMVEVPASPLAISDELQAYTQAWYLRKAAQGFQR